MNKYHNRKITIDGYIFDSIAEGNRYAELKILLKQGLIKDLKLQPKYRLQDSFKKNGITYRQIDYIADFEYFDAKLGGIVVEDVKGIETEVFKIKKKLFEKKYPDLSLTIRRLWT